MKVLLSGGSKSGKSHLAQELACKLARGRPMYYLATMVPADEEDRERIRRHVAERAGLGFVTVECGADFASGWRSLPQDAVFLLDSLTALLAQAMFPPGKPPVTDAGTFLSRELALLAAHGADGGVDFAHAALPEDYVVDAQPSAVAAQGIAHLAVLDVHGNNYTYFHGAKIRKICDLTPHGKIFFPNTRYQKKLETE